MNSKIISPEDSFLLDCGKIFVWGDIDEDLALCSYVCPSKYDYGSIIMSNLDKIYSEL